MERLREPPVSSLVLSISPSLHLRVRAFGDVFRQLQMPRRPHGPAEHLVCGFVTFEYFFGRVPLERAAKLHRQVADMADTDGTIANGHVADAALARGDAVEPVVVMVIALVQVNLIGAELDLENVRI